MGDSEQSCLRQNEITEVIETIDINKPDDVEVDEEEMQRYNFLFESSKEMYPDVCTYLIHMAVLEQIAEEKGVIPDEQNIEKLRAKYDNNLDEYDSIALKNFDDEEQE
tara:strand:+ start:164 stop:487 length:324 start_codon:yes stop_codon:yes gene_type:complete